MDTQSTRAFKAMSYKPHVTFEADSPKKKRGEKNDEVPAKGKAGYVGERVNHPQTVIMGYEIRETNEHIFTVIV